MDRVVVYSCKLVVRLMYDVYLRDARCRGSLSRALA